MKPIRAVAVALFALGAIIILTTHQASARQGENYVGPIFGDLTVEGEFTPGGTAVLLGNGFAPDSSLALTIVQNETSELTREGDATADAEGAARVEVQIDSDLAPGNYTASLKGLAVDGATVDLSGALVVLPEPTPEPATATAPSNDDDSGSGGADDGAATGTGGSAASAAEDEATDGTTSGDESTIPTEGAVVDGPDTSGSGSDSSGDDATSNDSESADSDDGASVTATDDNADDADEQAAVTPIEDDSSSSSSLVLVLAVIALLGGVGALFWRSKRKTAQTT